MAEDEGVAVNIDEHVKTPDEVIAHIATEYNISRLTTEEGRNAYFGKGPDGKMDLTKATGLMPEEVTKIR